MPVSAATLAKLLEAGFAGSELLDIVASIDADHAKARSSAALRQERYRERKKAGDVTSDATETITKPSQPHARVEGSSSKVENTGKKRLVATPRNELDAVLSPERAQAVIDHRRKIKKPLTDHAAKLLAAKFAQCPDPNAAADAMISNGWQGFEPEWIEARGRSPPNGARQQQSSNAENSVNVLERLRTSSNPSDPAADFSAGGALALSDFRRTG